MNCTVEKLKSNKHYLDTGAFWIRPSFNRILSFLVELDSVKKVIGQDLWLGYLHASTLSKNPLSE